MLPNLLSRVRPVMAVLILVLAPVLACAELPGRIHREGDGPERPRRNRPDRIYGEEPFEEPEPELSDDWSHSFVPNLIDIPATDLVDRHRPVLELGYVQRRFGGLSFSDAVRVAQDGFRLAFHVRAGRDLQISAQYPFYSSEIDLTGADPDVAGSLNAFSLELKYLSPYEIAGIRTAVGVRFGVADEDAVFFLPDDFMRQTAGYVSFSRTPWRAIRLHLSLMAVKTEAGGTGAPSPDYSQIAGGFEYDAVRAGHNFGRLIAEVVRPKTDGGVARYGLYGVNFKRDETYVNLGARIVSGIVQIDLGSRRAMQPGFDEWFFTLVKRF